MFIMGRRWSKFLLLTFSLILSPSDISAATPNIAPKIIILNSYHPGFKWSDNEVTGVLQELHSRYPGLDPSIEYLDDKRFPTPEHLLLAKNYLKNKYQGHKFDLVIALDNAALKLALDYRQELFPGIPVVFAGVSGLTPAMLAGKEGVTGVVEATATAETLEMALSFHPQTKEIFVVHDYTITGQAVRATIENIIPAFQGRVLFKFAPPSTMAELVKQLNALPDDTIIFIAAFITDQAGQSFSQAEAVRLLTEGIKRPAYIVIEDLLGHGPVGGILSGGKEEGRRAGEIALRVLNGEDPSGIPVDWKSPARPMFDYRQLSRFQIPLRALPQDSIIINRPISFYEVNKSLVWGTFGITVTLCLVVLFLSFNISRRKKAESALAEEAVRRRLLVDQSRDGIVVLDQNGKVYEANQKYAELLGYSVEEVHQLHVWDWDTQWTREELLEQIRKIDAAGDLFETSHRRRDGTLYDVEISTNGAVLGGKKLIFCVCRDISARKQAEETLRQKSEELETVLDTLPAFVWIGLDPECRVITGNRVVNELFGVMAGTNISQIMAEKDQAVHIKHLKADGTEYRAEELPMQRAVALGKPLHNLELIYALPDGRLIFAFGNAAPLFDGNGKVRGSVAAFLDITERKRADEERAKLQEQLAQAHKMEAIGTLAGGIAHDFNNILWAIMGYTELTMGSIPGGSKEHRNLQQILIASERARDLVNQILAFSRKAAQERKPLQLSLIVKETLKLLRATIPTTIDLKQEIASPNAMVLADSTQIHQLIMNLCTNSTQAMREKGDTLKIGLEEKDLDEDGLLEHPDLSPGPYVILIISDNGPGIAPEIIDRIFDPFFTTKEVGEGTGMGLAVVYGIVKSHGGGISVYSQPEAGTTFTVLLPKILNPESESKEVDTSIPQGCGHLLVIDDEKMLVDLTKKMLERLGYEVTASNSSLEALKIFQAQPDKFDLVITDQTMPHMTGMQLARQLRRIRPDIPIILCTGYSETVSEEKVIATGINKLLMKPVIMRRLAEAAREALEGIGDGPPSFAGVEK